MSKCKLRYVRQDLSVRVYTEHTDRIHPRDLSDSLAARVGKDKFRVSLLKNIYIIYVDARRSENDDNRDTLSDNGEERGEFTIEPKTHQQRLADFKMAEKILCEARLLIR